jgi:hypothetical protein
MRHIIFTILFLSTINISKAQEGDTIYWCSNTKLKWSDFNMNLADTCSKYYAVAMTACYNHVEYFLDGKLPNCNITVYFLKSQSCAKDTSLLIKISHEQVHFDIRELYARKMRRVVDRLRKENISNITVYKDSLRKLSVDANSYQNKYDFETSHGIIDSTQVQWEERVKEEMEKLKAYTSDCKQKKVQLPSLPKAVVKKKRDDKTKTQLNRGGKK